MTTAPIIPSYDCARRVATAFMINNPYAIGYRIFLYQQPRSGLTLYGVAVQFGDGHEQEVRFQ